MSFKLPSGSSSVNTSNCDKISCLVISCWSLGGSGTRVEGSSKMLLPGGGVNQSPLLGSSFDVLKSCEKELKSAFIVKRELSPALAVSPV